MPLSAKIIYILAALCHFRGYYLYNAVAFRRHNDPNAAAWFAWAVMAVLNALTYRSITDTISALQFIVGSICSLVTFFFMWYHGRLKGIPPQDRTILAVALIMLAIYKLLDAPALANIIFAVTFAVSFVPMYRDVRGNPFKETSTPWIWWTMGFVLNIIAAIIVSKPWYAFVTPVVLLVCHGSIAVLASPRRKLAFRSINEI